jgi:hypothetical protein
MVDDYVIYSPEIRNIRYSIDYQRLKPQQICNKSATGSQQPATFSGKPSAEGRNSGMDRFFCEGIYSELSNLISLFKNPSKSRSE